MKYSNKFHEAFKTANQADYNLLKEFAKTQRLYPTEAEKAMWNILRKEFKSFGFRRQHIIGEYIADFVCLSVRLVIEIDGGYHDVPEQQVNDQQRTEWLQTKGLQVIRFKNEDVLDSPQVVISTLKEFLINNSD